MTLRARYLLPRPLATCCFATMLVLPGCSATERNAPVSTDITGTTAAADTTESHTASDARESRAASDTTGTAAARGEPAKADSTASENPPTIRVKINEEDRAKLMTQIEADLEIARIAASSRPDPSTLSEEERQRWETLDQYIDLAKSSLAAGDIRASSELALKARLLADEIQPR